jgi:hypothetical protein
VLVLFVVAVAAVLSGNGAGKEYRKQTPEEQNTRAAEAHAARQPRAWATRLVRHAARRIESGGQAGEVKPLQISMSRAEAAQVAETGAAAEERKQQAMSRPRGFLQLARVLSSPPVSVSLPCTRQSCWSGPG